MSIAPQAHVLAPWVGLGVFAAYAFAAIAGAAVLLVKPRRLGIRLGDASRSGWP